MYWKLLKGTGVSPYIWAVLAILPFYFISQSPSTLFIIIGIILTLLFFLFYRLAFISKGWTVYLWTGFLIAISAVFSTKFSYVYFAFFLAYLIGNIKVKATFVILYFVHLVSTAAIHQLSDYPSRDLCSQTIALCPSHFYQCHSSSIQPPLPQRTRTA